MESRVCFQELEDWVREKVQSWVQELLEEEVTELLDETRVSVEAEWTQRRDIATAMARRDD